MECELWPQLYAIVVRAGRRMPKVRVRYSDALILLVLLWSGLHDRPLSWGCHPVQLEVNPGEAGPTSLRFDSEPASAFAEDHGVDAIH